MRTITEYHNEEDTSNRNFTENTFYFPINQIENTNRIGSKSTLTAEQIDQRRLAGIKSAEKRKKKKMEKFSSVENFVASPFNSVEPPLNCSVKSSVVSPFNSVEPPLNCSVESSVTSPFNSVETSVERNNKQNADNKIYNHYSVTSPLNCSVKSSVASPFNSVKPPLNYSVESSVASPFNSVENNAKENEYEKIIQGLQWQNEMLRREIAKILNQKVGYVEGNSTPKETSIKPEFEQKTTLSSGLFGGTLREIQRRKKEQERMQQNDYEENNENENPEEGKEDWEEVSDVDWVQYLLKNPPEDSYIPPMEEQKEDRNEVKIEENFGNNAENEGYPKGIEPLMKKENSLYKGNVTGKNATNSTTEEEMKNTSPYIAKNSIGNALDTFLSRGNRSHQEANLSTNGCEIIDLHNPLFPPHRRNELPSFMFEEWNEKDYERHLFFDGVEEGNRKKWIKKKKDMNKILFQHYNAQKNEFNKALYILQPIENLGYNDLISWCLERGIGSFFVKIYREEILDKIEKYKSKEVKIISQNRGIEVKNPFERERKWVGEQYDFVENLVELGVEREMAEHWREMRKGRNMMDNESIFNILEGEFRKSWEKFGTTPRECIEFSLSKNSCIFTFSYFSEHREVKNEEKNFSHRKEVSPLEEVMERFEKIFGEK